MLREKTEDTEKKGCVFGLEPLCLWSGTVKSRFVLLFDKVFNLVAQW